MPGPRLADLTRLSLREWRHHPWRHAAALLAVALGVTLAYSVHVINDSALSEFAAAVRSTQGEPDLVLRGGRDGFDDALFEQVVLAPGVLHASPVLEVDTYARAADGTRRPLQVLGVDLLALPALAPALVPRPHGQGDRLAAFDPRQVHLNVAAQQQLGLAAGGGSVELQAGPAWHRLVDAGRLSAGGAPLALMDIAAAQALFDRPGRLSRIDLRLAPGFDIERLALPPGVRAVAADDAATSVAQVSRAYRVNLTVLALVALLVGGFLVYSVVALSVAQRSAGFALLGVLGMTARERRRLVLLECTLTGAAGSLIGLLLGAGLALLALRWLAGDLGGGFFPGIAPTLRLDPLAALAFGALGTVSAVVGGLVPARQAERLQPAVALKGQGLPDAGPTGAAPALVALAGGAALAFLPPVVGLPLAAYASVGLLLFGGVAAVPVVVDRMLVSWPAPRAALPRLALRRAHHQRRTATAAVAGVVASLALCVALTVMVASFRSGVAAWLDQVLPADLYARSAGGSAAADQAWLPADAAARAAALPGVAGVRASRQRPLQLAAGRPAVVLIAREFEAEEDPARWLPLVGAVRPEVAGQVGVWVSEAVARLYGAVPGSRLALPLGGAAPVEVEVLGVWRDYARQFGSLVMRASHYRQLTGDTRLNDLALWLAPQADLAAVQQGLRSLVPDPALIEFAAAGEIRAVSLRIFDRSFAVTRYLQAVAIVVGLVGVAASLSAQVLARRKEFGLLAHLGLTRRQVMALVAGETGAWLAAGSAVGLVLGAAISVVLVFVVNPQSFHWTMEIVWPWMRLAALAAAVLAAGLATAAFAARHAASRSAVLSVKEDW